MEWANVLALETISVAHFVWLYKVFFIKTERKKKNRIIVTFKVKLDYSIIDEGSKSKFRVHISHTIKICYLTHLFCLLSYRATDYILCVLQKV